MRKEFFVLGVILCGVLVAGCEKQEPIPLAYEIDTEALKEEIKQEIMEEMREELRQNVERVEGTVKEIEDDVKDMENDVDTIESSQKDLETLFDVTKVSITTQGKDNQWNFSSSGKELTWTRYPTSNVMINTPYTVLIEQGSEEYKIIHEDFVATLSLEECSYNDGKIFAYYVEIQDKDDQILQGCANVKL